MRSAAAIPIVLFLGACPPDLDQFRVEGEGGEGEGEGEGEGTGGACPVPHLLVAVEDLRGGPGRVLRFALGDDLPLQRCGDLTAGGEMLGQPFAVAWVDEHRVAVANTDGVQILDPLQDVITGRASHGDLWPNDAFRVEVPGVGRRLAVAYSAYGSSDDIRTLRVYDDAGVITHDLQGNGGELPLGLGVYSMTQSPIHHEWLLAAKPGSYGAAEIDPWNQISYADAPYALDREGTVIDTIFGLEADQQNRVAFTGHDEAGSHVYYVLDPDGTPGHGVSLPLDCEGRACTFIHAVPDPTLNTRLLALCEEDGDYATRRIVRFRSTSDECEVVFEAGTLQDAADRRVAKLSVAWEVGE